MAEVSRVEDLVSYQQGSVVSRSIIKKSAGTVTAFAFDEGEGLSEHTAPYDALVQIIAGEARITVEGEAHRVAAGEMVVLPADVPHALQAEKPFKMLLTMIRA